MKTSIAFERLALFITSSRLAVDALPRTSTGKVQHVRLRELMERELGADRAS